MSVALCQIEASKSPIAILLSTSIKISALKYESKNISHLRGSDSAEVPQYNRTASYRPLRLRIASPSALAICCNRAAVSSCSSRSGPTSMNDDDIASALEEVEHELANIEAEITAPTPVTSSATVFQPISLASLSLQCKSMTLIDVVNVSLNSRNRPTSWAQNKARSSHVTAPPPTCNFPMQAGASVQHHASSVAATALGRVSIRNASNSWKRCLFAAAGITKPLATAWLDALHAADTAYVTCPVPSSLLRFLPLIDPLFADYATRDFVVHVSRRDLQVKAFFIPINDASFEILLQMLSAATLFALSSNPSCALLQVPLADSGLNQLLSLAFGDVRGHEDVLWQGEISSAYNPNHPNFIFCAVHAGCEDCNCVDGCILQALFTSLASTPTTIAGLRRPVNGAVSRQSSAARAREQREPACACFVQAAAHRHHLRSQVWLLTASASRFPRNLHLLLLM